VSTATIALPERAEPDFADAASRDCETLLDLQRRAAAGVS